MFTLDTKKATGCIKQFIVELDDKQPTYNSLRSLCKSKKLTGNLRVRFDHWLTSNFRDIRANGCTDMSPRFVWGTTPAWCWKSVPELVMFYTVDIFSWDTPPMTVGRVPSPNNMYQLVPNNRKIKPVRFANIFGALKHVL